jgi:TonB family protein
MKINQRILSLLILLLSLAPLPQANAQENDEKACAGPVFAPSEVSRRAKILEAPPPSYTEEARAHRVHGTVILRAVFCRSGSVTNVEVLRGLPYGLTEKAVESTVAMKFEPAQKDGEAVSQSFRREITFSLF